MNLTYAYLMDWSDDNLREVAIHSVNPVQPGWSVVWTHRDADAEPFSAPVIALCSASNAYDENEDDDDRQHHVVAVTADGDEFIIGLFFKVVADDRPST